jgi:hypothetical protein
MEIPELQDFNLAGGTSLSLQIGHRLSIETTNSLAINMEYFYTNL